MTGAFAIAAAISAVTASAAVPIAVVPIPAVSNSAVPIDRAALAQRVCLGPWHVPMDDVSAAGPGAVIVRCLSRGRIDGFRTRYLARCAGGGADWRCDAASFSLVVPAAGQDVDLLIRGRIGAGRAVALLRYAASISEFGVEDTSNWIQGICELGALDASSWELSCGSAHMQIAEDCRGNRCGLRMFLAERTR